MEIVNLFADSFILVADHPCKEISFHEIIDPLKTEPGKAKSRKPRRKKTKPKTKPKNTPRNKLQPKPIPKPKPKRGKVPHIVRQDFICFHCPMRFRHKQELINHIQSHGKNLW